MKDRERFFPIAFFALALVASLPAAVAQEGTGSGARIVRISFVQGTVTYNGAAAVINSPVTEDSRLITGKDGLAEVEFEDESTIRLASETEMSFAQLARLSTGEARTRVDMEEGEAEFLIPASSAGRFAINIRGKNILFKEPGRFRILNTHGTPLEIAVWKGEAGVRDLESGQEVTVKARETLSLNPEDLGQYKVENSVLADDLDRWSEQRDQDLRTNYVASGTYSNTVYDQQYYQGGGYANGYAVPYSFYGYNTFGCPYGFGQPFWFGGPADCWNSGFFFNPFFFPRPLLVVVIPPIHPRRPVVGRPPVVPILAKGGTGNTVAKPEFHNFRDLGQPVFGGGNFQRTGIKPGASSSAAQNSVHQTVLTPPTMPVQRPPVSNVPPPPHTAPPAFRPQHSSPPPVRAPSHFFSGSRGGSFSHASPPAVHISGRR